MKKSLFVLSALLVSSVVTADGSYGCYQRDGGANRPYREDGYYRGGPEGFRRDGREGAYGNRFDGNYRDEAFRADRRAEVRADLRDRVENRFEDNQDERRQARQERRRELLKDLDINIEISDGVVTLTGKINNEQERQELKARIRQIVDNIRKIDDQLEVKEAEKAQSSRKTNRRSGEIAWGETRENTAVAPEQIDGQILLEIQKHLKSGILSEGYPNVKAEVLNGNVTLTGAVKKDSDRQDLMKKVAELKGVKKVDNQLKVVPASK